MEVDVLNMEGEKVSKVELPAEIFEAPVNTDLMHQAFVRQMANARLGTHSTKGRKDVSGGGRKPWRQKGTGRARQGSTRAAQWVGGAKSSLQSRVTTRWICREKCVEPLCVLHSPLRQPKRKIVILDVLALPED